MKTMASAASGMAVQTTRLRLSAENMANADTPGFKRKIVSFVDAMSQEGARLVRVDRLSLDQKAGDQVYDPSHPLADAEGLVTGSNIDLVVEMADAREAQRSYEANLRMYDQARQMSASLIELLRR